MNGYVSGFNDPTDIFARTLEELITNGVDPEEAVSLIHVTLKKNMVAYCHELIRATSRDENFNAFIKVQKARAVIKVLKELEDGNFVYDGYRDLVLLERTLRDYSPVIGVGVPTGADSAIPKGRTRIVADLDQTAAAKLHQILYEMTKRATEEDLEEVSEEHLGVEGSN